MSLLNHVPDWYKDAVIYEVSIRTFKDANNDGVGDLAGLRQSLPYIQSLGVNCLWLLPMYPSPLLDGGYDISDYEGIHPDLGNLAEFQEFLSTAHSLGIRVIADLVINHTSKDHPWFQAAVSDPESPYRDYYVWSDDPTRYHNARIIFTDSHTSNWTWHDRAGAYYWHRFYSHQPDLNYDNPTVQEEMLQVVAHWLAMGLDGFRVDAVPYLYERDGTNCENLPETHAFCKRLRQFVDERFPGTLLLAEANQWPSDVAHYFGNDDEFHMCFNFPLMPRLFIAISRGVAWPIRDIIEQLPTIPENCQWALFLRNHDELSLEMVTDEERDVLYREYARDPRMRINLGIRRRLFPLLETNRPAIELLHSILFTLPGSPVLYYGDEIGMGDNPYLGDRDGVRTPMQWSDDRNAGFSRCDPSRMHLPVNTDPGFHYFSVNVESSERRPRSFLNWIRKALRRRSQSRLFGRGDIQFVDPQNPAILAYFRSYDGIRMLFVHNISSQVQYATLDLQAYDGLQPVEMFSEGRLPPINGSPYNLTIGPYGYYWIRLEGPGAGIVGA
jgi:maltose alpha-D-glucosyltransferase/alpha-amylase